jgi:prepilin-type N-terminal cleavage/methylation domain-containing protein
MITPMPNRSDAGFSLPELLISTAIVLVIIGAVTDGLLQTTTTTRMMWNRTEMHSGVRGVTELLQQEVGQAGFVSLPGGPVTLGTAVTVAGSQAVTLSSTAGMFVGEQLIVDAGCSDALIPCTSFEETVAVTAINGNQITATFTLAHIVGVPVAVGGGFSSGIVPPGLVNGSTGFLLKMYGDINSDGNMVYIEYTCDTVNHRLYRNMMPWNAASKPALDTGMILLDNIMPNPGGNACFIYQTATVLGTDYVTDVAITLTVQTQQVDPVTKQHQQETKTLLNVSPRNVFNTWELASMSLNDRIQPMPPTVLNLLH